MPPPVVATPYEDETLDSGPRPGSEIAPAQRTHGAPFQASESESKSGRLASRECEVDVRQHVIEEFDFTPDASRQHCPRRA